MRIDKQRIRWWAALGTALLCLSSSLSADDYADEWGPPVGTPMPPLSAPDQAGSPRTLANLTGDQGLLLFLNRSADW
jgi:hypothetical protein